MDSGQLEVEREHRPLARPEMFFQHDLHLPGGKKHNNGGRTLFFQLRRFILGEMGRTFQSGQRGFVLGSCLDPSLFPSVGLLDDLSLKELGNLLGEFLNIAEQTKVNKDTSYA